MVNKASVVFTLAVASMLMSGCGMVGIVQSGVIAASPLCKYLSSSGVMDALMVLGRASHTKLYSGMPIFTLEGSTW